MSASFEERKIQYIQTVEAAYLQPRGDYWQQPPSYSTTEQYALRYNKPVNTGEPLIIKKTKRDGIIILTMVVVASVLLYMVGKKESGFAYVGFLLLLLIVVLPVLLNNRTMIRMDNIGIWLHSLNKEIKWEQVAQTYIKEVQQEEVKSFFIIHYYDENIDRFIADETELDQWVSVGFLAAAIEAYKKLN
ncbi:MAG: hypothetical protein QM764_08310 [Chitinophagaceae bacterium]